MNSCCIGANIFILPEVIVNDCLALTKKGVELLISCSSPLF